MQLLTLVETQQHDLVNAQCSKIDSDTPQRLTRSRTLRSCLEIFWPYAIIIERNFYLQYEIHTVLDQMAIHIYFYSALWYLVPEEGGDMGEELKAEVQIHVLLGRVALHTLGSIQTHLASLG